MKKLPSTEWWVWMSALPFTSNMPWDGSPNLLPFSSIKRMIIPTLGFSWRLNRIIYVKYPVTSISQSSFFFFLLNLFILFIIYFWLCWVFAAARGLFPRRAGATLCCGARASHRGGLPCCGAQAPGARASVVVAHGLSSCGSRAPERRLSSCGARAQLLRSMWDPPGSGLEPASPALAGGLATTAPPGKPLLVFWDFRYIALYYGYHYPSYPSTRVYVLLVSLYGLLSWYCW